MARAVFKAGRQQDMAQADRLIIDFNALEWRGARTAVVETTEAVPAETVASFLMRVIRSGASEAAETDQLEPVSFNLDTTAPSVSGGSLTLDCEIDRRTRTLVFAHGSARLDAKTLMTATAVYRIAG